MEHIVAARRSRSPILVLQPVAGEAFTKLRYDKRVSPRRDAGVALAVLAMVDENPEAFRLVPARDDAYKRARAILAQYRDHAFSFVDAVIFDTVDRHPSVSRVLTVDGADFRSFRFTRPIEVVTPP